MESVTLRSGHFMPLIGLGTYKILGTDVVPAIDAALKAGYRLFDTAKVYGNEKEIGEALRTLLPKHNLTRKDVFIITKLHPSVENCREVTQKRVDESLELLHTDYIDLYLIHYPKPNESDNENPKNPEYRLDAYKVLIENRNFGKIRSVGVSSYEIIHLKEIKENNLETPSVNQIELHPHFVRKELVNYCQDDGIFVQAFSSLARHNEALMNNEHVVAIGEKYNVPVTTVLLSWAVSQQIGIIPKSTKLERLEQNRNLVILKDTEISKISELDIGQHYVRTTGWLVK